MRPRCVALVGAQYGSEGKGVIAAHLADRFMVHVRVGGPNAGHSFMHRGQLWKMRSLPCGWINLNATLVIGRGAIVDLELLRSEIAHVKIVDPTIESRVWLDAGAWAVGPADRQEEADRGMDRSISSTLEGVGSARVRRMRRSVGDDQRVGNVAHLYGLEKLLVAETSEPLSRMSRVLLEGTQGSGLSLLHGEWPFVTSADTNAAQLAADCGLPPSAIDDVLLVMRTFPIRVGGHSGPLHDEITWEQLGHTLGRRVEEYTTVTGRLRRIGRWDEELVRRAIRLNGAHKAALTFLDYLDPEVEGRLWLSDRMEAFLRDVEDALEVEIPLVGTGGPDFTVIERGEPLWKDD